MALLELDLTDEEYARKFWISEAYRQTVQNVKSSGHFWTLENGKIVPRPGKLL